MTNARLILKTKKTVAWVFFSLAILGYLIFALFPFFIMLSISFTDRGSILGLNTPIWPEKPTIENYVQIWRTIPLLHYIKNSVIVCVATVFSSLCLSIPASYGLSRFVFRGKQTFIVSVLATQLFPGITMLLPIYMMYVNFTRVTGFPMVRTLHGLVIAFATFGIPYSIWMLKSYFDSIPDELDQAAMIDGCTRFQAILKVILPLMVPGLIATGLYLFLLAWNNIVFSGVMTDQATRTFATGLREFQSEFTVEYGQLMAACSVTVVPVVLVFFGFQRYFVSGLTGGAVKG